MASKNTTTARIGRPPVYTGNQKRHIVGLIRTHGATGARNILLANATSKDKAEQALAAQRNASVVPGEGLNISMPTLLKFAKAAGVVLKIGRPAKVA